MESRSVREGMIKSCKGCKFSQTVVVYYCKPSNLIVSGLRCSNYKEMKGILVSRTKLFKKLREKK